ncbi:MAG: hypothetical protein WBV23_09610 [Desulfobaccales bacterium]
MKTLVRLLMTKASICGGAAVAILILLGAAAYADEAAPTGNAPDGYIFTLNRKTAETFYEMKEQRVKAVQSQKDKEEEKLSEQKKMAKVDKIQRKTGRTATSWQLMNR